MLNLFIFLVSQFFGIFAFLDELVIYGNLTLLKVLIIVFIFTFALKFIFHKERN